jgi:hypothetical protein
VWVSNSGGGKSYLSSSKRPDCLWGPHTFVFGGCRGFFPGVKWPGREVIHSSSSSAEVRCSYAPPVWNEQWHCRCVSKKGLLVSCLSVLSAAWNSWTHEGPVFLVLYIGFIIIYMQKRTDCNYNRTEITDTFLEDMCMTLITKRNVVTVPYLPVFWLLLWPGGWRTHCLLPKIFCVVFFSSFHISLIYWNLDCLKWLVLC